MAKVILSVDGVTLKEIPLARERTIIGRKAHNDIQIDNLAISGEHAAIISLMNDAFLEDLGSTNGTYVNGRPVKKHFLQDGDVIELAKYRLKYVSEGKKSSSADAEKTMVLRRGAMHCLSESVPGESSYSSPDSQSSGHLPSATLQLLNGNNVGRELNLTKTVTTLGKPGVLVAAIARRPLGYFITHVEGARAPVVCGRVLETDKPYALMDHDIIELGGVRMAFYLKG